MGSPSPALSLESPRALLWSFAPRLALGAWLSLGVSLHLPASAGLSILLCLSIYPTQVDYADGDVESMHVAMERLRLLMHAGERLSPPPPARLRGVADCLRRDAVCACSQAVGQQKADSGAVCLSVGGGLLSACGGASRLCLSVCLSARGCLSLPVCLPVSPAPRAATHSKAMLRLFCFRIAGMLMRRAAEIVEKAAELEADQTAAQPGSCESD
jgi:hypothetical protein